ncbi:MAG TPA: FAD/NAD(P)-binding oxidoreductase [Nitrosopumilaceae archaeon]|nr:FAD/NAD(P)-binding oxidoreductase [Nitrosopumilaceae archaeon]
MISIKSANILILGGGFGGLAAANELRQSLPLDFKITVIDKKDYFMMDLVKLWILNGTREFEFSKRPLQPITKKGIDFINDEIVKIDPKNKTVATRSKELSYDYLIISLGVDLAPEQIPGLSEHGLILYETKDVPKIRDVIKKMKSGKIVMAIMGMPYKCPPAPYEAALLIKSMLKDSGTNESVQIDFYSPTPITLPAAGPQVSEELLQLLKSNDINFHGSHKTISVVANTLKFENSETGFDLLIAIPPHKAPTVVVESGFAQQGKFIRVDRSCKTSFENVYAIGDVNEIMVTDKIAVPKAGIFAEGEGVTVAKNIVSQIKREQEKAVFDGKGGCFVEVGKKIAGYLEVDMFASPNPVTLLKQPAQEHFMDKEKFEKDRLAKWL